MNKNLLKPKSNSAFNYTLLLDDVMELASQSYSDSPFEFSGNFSPDSFGCKAPFAEIRTQGVELDSDQDLDFESPTKFNEMKKGKEAKMRKSDGCLPRGVIVKNQPKVLDFLTENSEEEEEGRDCGFNDFQPKKFAETKSEKVGENILNFSLSSCFKNNMSHFGINSFMSSKLNVDFSEKINGKKLKLALKSKHFDKIMAKITKVIENGGTCSS